MALGDYILCCKCEVKLIYDGDRGQREWWEERFGKNPEIECPDCKPQRTWVGLTDEEIGDIAKNYALSNPTTPLHFTRAIEAKLKEKNT